MALDWFPLHSGGVDVAEPVGHTLLDLDVEHAVFLHEPAEQPGSGVRNSPERVLVLIRFFIVGMLETRKKIFRNTATFGNK